MTPRKLGYRFPAEWEPHAATWLAWPHKPETWPDRFEPIPAVWATLARTLARYEPVRILAGGTDVMEQARRLTAGASNIVLHDIVTDDVWVRDHGPCFLVGPPNAPPALVDWKYNSWGGKYPPFDLDDRTPEHIANELGQRRFTPNIVLEGGAIDVNGRGSVLTTEQCLLNPNRNPGLTRTEIESYLAEYLAAPHVIWLSHGIVGDDTDGHIDELARFVGPRTVVAAVEEDPADPNFEPLAENLARLRRAVDEQGRPLEIVPLPMPKPVYFGEHRLPAGYCNFYIANGAVIVPTFGDPADRTALDALGQLFPDREIIGQRAVELCWGLGAFHCITQQQPRQS